MNTFEISEIYLWSILVFLESAEDIGYTEDKGSVRDWFTSLPIEEMKNKIDFLLELIERDAKD